MLAALSVTRFSSFVTNSRSGINAELFQFEKARSILGRYCDIRTRDLDKIKD